MLQMLNVFDMRVQIADIRSLLDSRNTNPIPQQQTTNHAIAEGDMSDVSHRMPLKMIALDLYAVQTGPHW